LNAWCIGSALRLFNGLFFQLNFQEMVMATQSNPILAAVAVGAVLLAPGGLHAQERTQAVPAETARNYGTINSPVSTDIGGKSVAPTAAISAVETYKSAQYSSGGVGLRNLGTGTLHISGVVTPVKAAFLYWAVITNGAAPAAAKSAKLTQTFPAGKSETVTGTLLGTGASPCWPGNTISVFRATVPVGDVSGNGSYQVAFASGASGSVKGQDPWLADTLPLLEGASLVVVGSGTGTVYVFDNGLAGKTFGNHTNPETFSYTLSLPTATNGGQVLFESIGADGQIGTSRTAGNVANDQPYLAAKAVQINGDLISGPFSATYIDFDSDWNGNAAAPLPRLWDDVGHDITAAAPDGTKSLSTAITTYGDCLTPVANVVAVY
jgi:hypothetical protein